MSAAPSPPRNSSRLALAGIILAALLLGGVFAWRHWRKPAEEPVRLEFDFSEVDSSVAEVIKQEHDRVRKSPKSAEAWGRLGQVLTANLVFKIQAQVCFEQAAKLAPNEPRWQYHLGMSYAPLETDRGIECLLRSADLCDEQQLDNQTPRLRAAEFLAERNRITEAEEQLDIVERAKPNNPRARLLRGLIACRREQWKTALKLLLPLVDVPEARRRACYQLAQVYRQLNNTDRAYLYSQLAQSDRDDAPWEDPYFQELRDLEVNKESQLTRVGHLKEARQPQEALEILQRLLRETEGKDGRVWLSLADTLSSIGQLDEAEKAGRKALELAPNTYSALYQLASLLHQRGMEARKEKKDDLAKKRFEEAVELGRKAVLQGTTNAWGTFQVGHSLSALGRFKEALPYLEKAVAAKPDSWAMHQVLGETLAELGRKEQAEKHLLLAVKLVPRQPNPPPPPGSPPALADESLKRWRARWTAKKP